MKGILIKSALALSLGVAYGPALAQTEQPAQGQSTECPAGTECPQGGAEQGQQPEAQDGATQQGGEATGQGQQGQSGEQQPKAEQGGTEQQQQSDTQEQQQGQDSSGQQQQTDGDASQSGTEQKPAQGETEQQHGETQQQSGEGESQQTQEGQASGSSTDVDVTVEQKTEITQIIKEEKVEPIDVDFAVSVGVAVPETVKVKLRPVPARIIRIVPRYEGYLFFVLADGRIVIVEPSSLKIVIILA
ncbi:MAG: DUF1236 domain-containing protein [Sinorhizobium fredii]|uniref:DUF1236 domain-containing protein n=1 Tax=Rhizobium fredii TaxID=380 RepID=UPI0004AE2B49|nr:DUF1236 domain-containing protein [Sinorhizobium fredii]MCG5473981.1 DUF1236 domain-containing protein [Sinorhizobium fredii]